MKWFICYDGAYTFISKNKKLEFKADEFFNNFSEAKKCLVRYHQSRVDDAKFFLKTAKSLKPKDAI